MAIKADFNKAADGLALCVCLMETLQVSVGETGACKVSILRYVGQM